jgi:hypothetical protein
MMANEKKQELKTFPWKAVESAPSIYANMSNVSWTVDDLRITFGSLISESISGKDDFKILEQGSVVIPWRQAKNLSVTLSRIVADYERRNGDIGVPFLADPGKDDLPPSKG